MILLKNGENAPAFKITDLKGKKTEVPVAGKWTFVSFHRFAACPFCVLRTHELIKASTSFSENNIEIISLWPSSEKNMKKFIGSNNTPFSLIADPEKKIYKKYGVTKSSMLSLIKLFIRPALLINTLKHMYINMKIDSRPDLLPAEFLINPEGKITIAHYGQHYGDHLPIPEIIVKCKPK